MQRRLFSTREVTQWGSRRRTAFAGVSSGAARESDVGTFLFWFTACGRIREGDILRPHEQAALIDALTSAVGASGVADTLSNLTVEDWGLISLTLPLRTGRQCRDAVLLCPDQFFSAQGRFRVEQLREWRLQARKCAADAFRNPKIEKVLLRAKKLVCRQIETGAIKDLSRLVSEVSLEVTNGPLDRTMPISRLEEWKMFDSDSENTNEDDYDNVEFIESHIQHQHGSLAELDVDSVCEGGENVPQFKFRRVRFRRRVRNARSFIDSSDEGSAAEGTARIIEAGYRANELDGEVSIISDEGEVQEEEEEEEVGKNGDHVRASEVPKDFEHDPDEEFLRGWDDEDLAERPHAMDKKTYHELMRMNWKNAKKKLRKVQAKLERRLEKFEKVLHLPEEKQAKSIGEMRHILREKLQNELLDLSRVLLKRLEDSHMSETDLISFDATYRDHDERVTAIEKKLRLLSSKVIVSRDCESPAMESDSDSDSEHEVNVKSCEISSIRSETGIELASRKASCSKNTRPRRSRRNNGKRMREDSRVSDSGGSGNEDASLPGSVLEEEDVEEVRKKRTISPIRSFMGRKKKKVLKSQRIHPLHFDDHNENDVEASNLRFDAQNSVERILGALAERRTTRNAREPQNRRFLSLGELESIADSSMTRKCIPEMAKSPVIQKNNNTGLLIRDFDLLDDSEVGDWCSFGDVVTPSRRPKFCARTLNENSMYLIEAKNIMNDTPDWLSYRETSPGDLCLHLRSILRCRDASIDNQLKMSIRCAWTMLRRNSFDVGFQEAEEVSSWLRAVCCANATLVWKEEWTEMLIYVFLPIARRLSIVKGQFLRFATILLSDLLRIWVEKRGRVSKSERKLFLQLWGSFQNEDEQIALWDALNLLVDQKLLHSKAARFSELERILLLTSCDDSLNLDFLSEFGNGNGKMNKLSHFEALEWSEFVWDLVFAAVSFHIGSFKTRHPAWKLISRIFAVSPMCDVNTKSFSQQSWEAALGWMRFVPDLVKYSSLMIYRFVLLDAVVGYYDGLCEKAISGHVKIANFCGWKGERLFQGDPNPGLRAGRPLPAFCKLVRSALKRYMNVKVKQTRFISTMLDLLPRTHHGSALVTLEASKGNASPPYSEGGITIVCGVIIAIVREGVLSPHHVDMVFDKLDALSKSMVLMEVAYEVCLSRFEMKRLGFFMAFIDNVAKDYVQAFDAAKRDFELKSSPNAASSEILQRFLDLQSLLKGATNRLVHILELNGEFVSRERWRTIQEMLLNGIVLNPRIHMLEFEIVFEALRILVDRFEVLSSPGQVHLFATTEDLPSFAPEPVGSVPQKKVSGAMSFDEILEEVDVDVLVDQGKRAKWTKLLQSVQNAYKAHRNSISKDETLRTALQEIAEIYVLVLRRLIHLFQVWFIDKDSNLEFAWKIKTRDQKRENHALRRKCGEMLCEVCASAFVIICRYGSVSLVSKRSLADLMRRSLLNFKLWSEQEGSKIRSIPLLATRIMLSASLASASHDSMILRDEMLHSWLTTIICSAFSIESRRGKAGILWRALKRLAEYGMYWSSFNLGTLTTVLAESLQFQSKSVEDIARGVAVAIAAFWNAVRSSSDGKILAAKQQINEFVLAISSNVKSSEDFSRDQFYTVLLTLKEKKAAVFNLPTLSLRKNALDHICIEHCNDFRNETALVHFAWQNGRKELLRRLVLRSALAIQHKQLDAVELMNDADAKPIIVRISTNLLDASSDEYVHQALIRLKNLLKN